ncbi:MAG: ABC transporter ATP-binding protein [Halieaceae bacterium]|jgi:putative ABC transport system ATP-binding protein|nr:ABC transporter ATP-binding protein [Halieaceae bacterium]
MITATNLGKRVAMASGELAILKGIQLEIKSGETAAIIGASGSGKSTLLGLLAGLDTPTEGDVTIDGTSLGDLDEDGRAALRGREVGFVFQAFQLLPALTALENVMLPLELKGDDRAGPRAAEFLERVGLADRQDHYPRQLSGGEQQRVAIARAFAGSPRILFADEPTGNLDRATGTRIADLLFDLNREEGTTLVLVTHDLSLASRCARRFEMDSGTLREAAAVEA